MKFKVGIALNSYSIQNLKAQIYFVHLWIKNNFKN